MHTHPRSGVDAYVNHGSLIEMTDENVLVVPHGFIALPLVIGVSANKGRKSKKDSVIYATMLVQPVPAPALFNDNVSQSTSTAILKYNKEVLTRKLGEKPFADKMAGLQSFFAAM